MLSAWDESSTWNSMSGGIQLDDVEASSIRDSVLVDPDALGPVTFTGLRETVQARAVRKVCGHIDAPCSELPHYEGLENDRAVMEALSEALLNGV